MTAVVASTDIPLIRRNLDQTAVGIPAIHRLDRSQRALFGDRTRLDRDAAAMQVLDHVLGPDCGDEAKVGGAGPAVHAGEPRARIAVMRAQVDLLAAELQCGVLVAVHSDSFAIAAIKA